MECLVEEKITNSITQNNHIDSEIPSIGNITTKSFMFTEEQITKQLVDMREQTDFMKKFRSALGIALREIKTLRTTMNTENSNTKDGPTVRKRHSSCSAIVGSSSRGENLAGTTLTTSSGGVQNSCSAGDNVCGKENCVCSEFGGIDLAILRDYLSKMALHETKLVPRTQSLSEYVKAVHKDNVDKLKSTSDATENAVRHIESLKKVVANKNAAVEKLCKQLTQARLMRVKREAKLEQKLVEMKEWKEKYEKVKKSNDKQVKITQGLRLALNSERQKVKSSEKMARSLEQTRQAFESLKSQAGQLMGALRDKDQEIAELSSRLIELQSGDGYMYIQDQMTSPQIHDAIEQTMTSSMCQTDHQQCMDCDRYRREVEELRDRYDLLSRDFENYRRTFKPHGMHHHSLHSSSHPRDVAVENHGRQFHPHNLPHNHPYGNRRGRMHAPYTSADSYRKVSRPPLRRRLHYDMQSGESYHTNSSSDNTGSSENTQADALLSPIDESDETNDEASARKLPISVSQNNNITGISNVDNEDMTPNSNTVLHEKLQYNAHNTHIEPFSKLHSIDLVINESHNSPKSPAHVSNVESPNFSPLLDQGPHQEQKSNEAKKDEHPRFHKDGHNFPGHRHPHHYNPQGSKPKVVESMPHGTAESVVTNSPNVITTPDKSPIAHEKSLASHEKSSKTSYLELGTSATPSPSSSIKSGGDGLGEPESLCLNSFIRHSEPDNTIDTESDLSSLPNDDIGYQENTIDEAGPVDLKSAPTTFGVIWHPALIRSEPAQNARDYNVDTATGMVWGPEQQSNSGVTKTDVTNRKPRKTELRCVTYKGHKIDVTDFSIHAFREIIWSLDGGPESADDFIKFLASLAKKLNANPKWAGRHSMGNPKDWLSLRGLY